MEVDQQQVEAVTSLAPVNDSKAEAELAKFVAENRQHVPTARSMTFGIMDITPEAVAAAEAREQREAEQAAARHRADLHERAKALVASAGQRYRNCTLESFECKSPQQRKVVGALTDYLRGEENGNVILFGPVGTGKDHLAFALCKSAVKAGRTVSWINGQKWFGIVRDAMDTDKSEASLIADLSRPDVLCLSDPLPPVGPLTQFQATMLYRLVDARYAKGLPTICTINVANDAEADERMGAATWDRLTHDAWKLNCAWPTYRTPAREV